MSQPTTIRDISVATGLSTYSVSQALAGKPGVGAETRQRVLQVADELGYVRNNSAASLKDATSRTVGVLSASGRNSYYAVLVQAIDAVLHTAGYHAVSNDAMRGDTYRVDLERQGVQDLLQQRVAAIIATYSLAPDSLALLDRWKIPVVFADSLPPASSARYPFVGVDNYAASAAVANYLADLGHSTALFLAYPAEWNTRVPREKGFTEAAQSRELTVEVLEARNSSDSAYQQIRRRLDGKRQSWPTAIYASNIVLLEGALKALRDLGARIPADISVVGFDDFDWSELIDPPITVIDQHIAAVGEAAANTVLRLIRERNGHEIALDQQRTAIQTTLPTDLVIRSSCSSPRRPGPA